MMMGNEWASDKCDDIEQNNDDSIKKILMSDYDPQTMLMLLLFPQLGPYQ